MAEYSKNRIRVALAELNRLNWWLAEIISKLEITMGWYVENKTQPSLEQLPQIARILCITQKD